MARVIWIDVLIRHRRRGSNWLTTGGKMILGTTTKPLSEDDIVEAILDSSLEITYDELKGEPQLTIKGDANSPLGKTCNYDLASFLDIGVQSLASREFKIHILGAGLGLN